MNADGAAVQMQRSARRRFAQAAEQEEEEEVSRAAEQHLHVGGGLVSERRETFWFVDVRNVKDFLCRSILCNVSLCYKSHIYPQNLHHLLSKLFNIYLIIKKMLKNEYFIYCTVMHSFKNTHTHTYKIQLKTAVLSDIL